MRVQFVPERAELSLLNPANQILVENSEDRVLIRAAHDNFSEQEKIVFIRYLAAEGFISDEFENYQKSGWRGTSIAWGVNRSRRTRSGDDLTRVDRFMMQLLISASILWFGALIFAFVRSPF